MHQSPSTRRGRLLWRSLTIAVLVAVSAASFALPAAADQPVLYPATVTYSTQLSGVCEFPVDLSLVANGIGIDFYNKSGGLTRTFNHAVEQDTFTANGKTLMGVPYDVNIQLLFDSSGQLTAWWATGVFEKIVLPDGSLFISAGRAEFLHQGADFLLSPDHGNPGDVAAFCAALSQ
jgi:hypothetical protein